MKRRWVALGVGAAMVLGMSACGDDGGGALGSSGSFCDLARSADSTSNELSGSFDSGLPDSKSLKKLFSDFINQAKAAQKKAPSALKDDLAASITAFEKFQKILDKYNYDILKAANDPAFQAIGDDLDATGARVEQALFDECGIPKSGDFSSDDSGSSDTTSPEVTAPDITLPGGGSVPDLGSGDIDAQVKILQGIFPKLDADQARCLIDKGADFSSGDSSQYLQLLAECNISIEDFLGS